jgi:ABC-2 type transport system permease protein
MSAVVYVRETRFEFLRLLRFPMFVTLTLFVPTMLYTLFGIIATGGKLDGPAAAFVLVGWSTYAIMGASLFGFGVALAVERGLGWLELKRASPMPPSAYFVAKLVTCLLFSLVIVLLLLTIGLLFGGVRLAPGDAVRLVSTLVAGATPFCALGLVVGYFASPNSAPAVANVLYLPMTFASGLLIPLEGLPRIFQWVAPFLPPYHLSRLVLAATGVGSDGQVWYHVGALAIFTVACLGLAFVGHRRGED